MEIEKITFDAALGDQIFMSGLYVENTPNIIILGAFSFFKLN